MRGRAVRTDVRATGNRLMLAITVVALIGVAYPSRPASAATGPSYTAPVMSGSQLPSPTGSPGQGSATVVFSGDGTAVLVSGSYSGLEGEETSVVVAGAAAPGAPASGAMFTLSGTGGTSGTFGPQLFELSQSTGSSDRIAFSEGRVEVSIETTSFSSGEVRGQFDAAPEFYGQDSDTFLVGYPGSYTLDPTGGYPAPSITESGALPSGVSFSDGTFSGTPAPGSAGRYLLTITASNGVSPDASATFELNVDGPPSLPAAGSASGGVGSDLSLRIAAGGLPPPSLSESGALPGGVSFTDSGFGYATLAGVPERGSEGSYPVTVIADNGLGTDASESFTLTVTRGSQAVQFVSDPPTDAVVGSSYAPGAIGGGSGKPVTISVDPSSSAGSCAWSGSSVLLTGAGTCTLDANQAGDADYLAAPTATQSFSVVATVPGAPRGVTAVPGLDSATVSWAVPASTGGEPITGYTVTSTPGGATCASSGATSCTIRGLSAAVVYTFSVAALNSVGTGPGASAATAVAPLGPSPTATSSPPLPLATTPVQPAPAVPTSTSTAGGGRPAGRSALPTVAVGAAVLQGGHSLALRLSCLFGRCHGTVQLYMSVVRRVARRGRIVLIRRERLLGRSVYTVPAGRARTVRLRLDRLGRQVLSASRHPRTLLVRASLSGGRPTTRRVPVR